MLENVLKETIKEKGSIDLYEYMKLCQMHPEFGYYSRKPADHILGNKGDFITSPEISSIFGEMSAFWIFLQWERIGRPYRFNLLELGGGRGVLMQDAIATLQKLSSFSAKFNIHFLEINPGLRKLQQQQLSGKAESTHHESLDFLNEEKHPIFVIANEFFDALPVQQYVCKDDLWYKAYVELDTKESLSLVHVPYDGQPEHTEIQPDVQGALRHVYGSISRCGGASVFIDYGYWEGKGDTLQAVYQHKNVSPFDHPGLVDLSVHVDFKNMALQCSNYGLHYNYSTQRQFLMDFGIVLRASQGNNPNSEEVRKAVRRLIDPAEMGHLFKVLEVWK